MNIVFNTFSFVEIFLVIAIAVDFILATLVLLNKQKDIGSRFFIVASYWVTFWVSSMLLFQLISNQSYLIIPAKFLYIAGILITHNFFLFSYEFLRKGITVKKSVLFITTILTFVSIGFIAFSNTIVQSIVVVGGEKVILFGDFYVLYVLLLFSYVGIGYVNLLNHFFKTKEPEKVIERRQLLYVIIGTGFSIFVSLIGNIILPYFGNFSIHWVGPVVNITFVVATTYAILKYRLFNAKVIATQLFIFSLWVIILSRTLLSQTTQDQLINAGLLVSTIILGIFLIRSVIKEVEAREQIEKLAKDLEAANVRLKELDQLKSEFVSIASHQLRSPLTAIKGYASLILEGSFGKVTPAIGEAVGKMLDSSSRLVLIIEDFLNLSRIEQGKMKYDFVPTDVEKLVKSVVDELSPTIKTAGLSIFFTTDSNPPYKSNLDVGKIKQVINNIIDNSIKYTPRGSILVNLQRTTDNERQEEENQQQTTNNQQLTNKNKILITVSDTGIGISKDTLPTLFGKFSRAKDASKTNTTGTGLGLYVAKQMVEAHGGRIWAESDGVGKGSRFMVELGGV